MYVYINKQKKITKLKYENLKTKANVTKWKTVLKLQKKFKKETKNNLFKIYIRHTCIKKIELKKKNLKCLKKYFF